MYSNILINIRLYKIRACTYCYLTLNTFLRKSLVISVSVEIVYISEGVRRHDIFCYMVTCSSGVTSLLKTTGRWRSNLKRFNSRGNWRWAIEINTKTPLIANKMSLLAFIFCAKTKESDDLVILIGNLSKCHMLRYYVR